MTIDPWMSGPWSVDFRRPDGAVLMNLIAADRYKAAEAIKDSLPHLRLETIGDFTVTLQGPNGQVLEGDDALEGVILTTWFVEPGDGTAHEVPATPWQQHEDQERRANELVTRFILRTYRQPGEAANSHLKDCPDILVEDQDAYDGERGCDTGCSYVRLEAVMTCPHGEREEFRWGEFGRLASILEELEEEERRQS
jgi:hypothetical protein